MDIVVITAMFQLAVFVFFLLLKKNRHLSNILLATFLFAQFMILLNGLARNLSYNYGLKHLILFYPGMAFLTLVSPVMYFYVRSLAFADFTFTKKHLLHFIPFAVMLLFFTGLFIRQFHPAIVTDINTGSMLSLKFYIYFCVLYYTQILIYNSASLLVLADYQSKIKEQYSSLNRINLSWLRIVLYGFIIAWLIDVLRFLSVRQIIAIHIDLQLPVMIAFFVFFNIIFFKGWSQPQIFAISGNRAKYQSSPLTSTQAIEYKKMLHDFMLKHKPFLNPDITLKELAEECNIPPRYLSQIINEHYQQNFYDFISKYRIEESKSLLMHSRQNRKTVLEIMYEAGFNSKSAFHIAFKKYTGMTPVEFKNSLAH